MLIDSASMKVFPAHTSHRFNSICERFSRTIPVFLLSGIPTPLSQHLRTRACTYVHHTLSNSFMFLTPISSSSSLSHIKGLRAKFSTLLTPATRVAIGSHDSHLVPPANLFLILKQIIIQRHANAAQE